MPTLDACSPQSSQPSHEGWKSQAKLPFFLEKSARYCYQEGPLEKGLATYSSILAWRNPWTEEPGGLQFIGSQRIGHNWSYLACTHCRRQLGKAEVLKCNPSITLWSLEKMQILWSYIRSAAAAAAAKSLQLCPTLWDPIDGSPPGSPVPGILQTRTLEWVAISFSNALKWKVKVKSFSRVRLLATPWTAAYQAPLSMEFSRQEYWSGVPSPSPHQIYHIANHMSWFWHVIKWKSLTRLCLCLSKWLWEGNFISLILIFSSLKWKAHSRFIYFLLIQQVPTMWQILRLQRHVASRME